MSILGRLSSRLGERTEAANRRAADPCLAAELQAGRGVAAGGQESAPRAIDAGRGSPAG